MKKSPPFWQPATKRPQIWRTLLGIFLITIVTVVLGVGIFLAVANQIEGAWNYDQFIRTPAGMAAFFLTFLGYHIALMATLPLLHRRGYRSLLGPTARLNPRHYLNGILIILAVLAAALVLEFFVGLILPSKWLPSYYINPFDTWILWLAPFVALIFVQTLAEEMLFRGYLLQQLRARFASPLIWAVLPSLLFGALHYDGATYGVNAYAYVFNTAMVGVLLSYVTLRTGNLGAAAGLHFANNLLMLLIGVEGNLDAVSLTVMSVDLKGGYMTYSLLSQTVLEASAFILWWRWMDRRGAPSI